jgi:hypothetical protein
MKIPPLGTDSSVSIWADFSGNAVKQNSLDFYRSGDLRDGSLTQTERARVGMMKWSENQPARRIDLERLIF